MKNEIKLGCFQVWRNISFLDHPVLQCFNTKDVPLEIKTDVSKCFFFQNLPSHLFVGPLCSGAKLKISKKVEITQNWSSLPQYHFIWNEEIDDDFLYSQKCSHI